ncbi:MAG: ABC transporter permease, partial [Candidatus Omnitrophica bacterium]|nr:ABC transporter permease [Candidatus Omnitrophota bacterium]
FLQEASYKLSFLLNLFSVITTLLTYYFIDKLFGYKMTSYLNEFGVNYFPYVLLSQALFSYIGIGIGSFSSRIRLEQVQGTLESLLATPTEPYIILIGMGLWNMIIASINCLIYLAAGVFIFKIDFSNFNFLSTSLILLLTITSFSGLGILSASFIIIFKRGNPVGWMMNILEGTLGGVYFPVTVMPSALLIAAKFLPITYAVRAVELAVYRGYSPVQLKTELGFLLLFSLLLLPLGLKSFKWALEKAKRSGTLSQY